MVPMFALVHMFLSGPFRIRARWLNKFQSFRFPIAGKPSGAANDMNVTPDPRLAVRGRRVRGRPFDNTQDGLRVMNDTNVTWNHRGALLPRRLCQHEAGSGERR